MNRILAAVGLLSASIIGFELVLMQTFSFTQWYHFAFMVISVALLGFGLGGALLFITRSRMLPNWSVHVPVLALTCGIAMVVMIPFSQTGLCRFDSYRVFLEWDHVISLGLTSLLLAVPFLCCSMVVGIVLTACVKDAGRIYASNMAGSAAGSLLAVGLMWNLLPQQAAALFGALSVLAGFLVSTRRTSLMRLIAFLSVLAGIVFLIRPPELQGSEYKSVSRALNIPDAQLVDQRPSPFGIIQTVSSRSLRSAPGLSLAYSGTLHPKKGMFNNGDWYGPLEGERGDDGPHDLDFTTLALPYVMRPRERVLVLDAGTGEGVSHALSRGSSAVTAVEPHEGAMRVLLGGEEALTPYADRRVAVCLTQARSYLETDTSHHDAIILPLLETFGGTGGAQALREQWAFTTEAFSRMWDKLAPGGVISASTWMDYPPRVSLRLLATLGRALENEGIPDPRMHLTAVRSWGTVTFCAKKTPLTEDETRRIRRFCGEMLFDPLLLPDLAEEERQANNRLADDRFLHLIDGLVGPERDSVVERYDFRISPATDSRPYFLQFVRLWTLPRLSALFGGAAVPFLEMGYLIILLTAVQIVPASFLIILLPFRALRMRVDDPWGMFVFYGSLGLGYMFVEMTMIHRFTFYFGHPVYASAVVLGGMLLMSGLGGSYSSAIVRSPRSVPGILVAVVLLIVFTFSTSAPFMDATIGGSGIARVVLACLFMGPMAFMMGIPFPSTLRMLPGGEGSSIPWAWGINGCFSVAGTVCATILLVESGFEVVMGGAAAAYAVAGLTFMFWKVRHV